MRLTASDVQAARFPVALRGYAEDEVDALLALVIETLREHENRDAAARAEIERLRSALDRCREALVDENLHALRNLYRETEDRMESILQEALDRVEGLLGEVGQAVSEAPPES